MERKLQMLGDGPSSAAGHSKEEKCGWSLGEGPSSCSPGAQTFRGFGLPKVGVAGVLSPDLFV